MKCTKCLPNLNLNLLVDKNLIQIDTKIRYSFANQIMQIKLIRKHSSAECPMLIFNPFQIWQRQRNENEPDVPHSFRPSQNICVKVTRFGVIWWRKGLKSLNLKTRKNFLEDFKMIRFVLYLIQIAKSLRKYQNKVYYLINQFLIFRAQLISKWEFNKNSKLFCIFRKTCLLINKNNFLEVRLFCI